MLLLFGSFTHKLPSVGYKYFLVGYFFHAPARQRHRTRGDESFPTVPVNNGASSPLASCALQGGGPLVTRHALGGRARSDGVNSGVECIGAAAQTPAR